MSFRPKFRTKPSTLDWSPSIGYHLQTLSDGRSSECGDILSTRLDWTVALHCGGTRYSMHLKGVFTWLWWGKISLWDIWFWLSDSARVSRVCCVFFESTVVTFDVGMHAIHFKPLLTDITLHNLSLNTPASRVYLREITCSHPWCLWNRWLLHFSEWGQARKTLYYFSMFLLVLFVRISTFSESINIT